MQRGCTKIHKCFTLMLFICVILGGLWFTCNQLMFLSQWLSNRSFFVVLAAVLLALLVQLWEIVVGLFCKFGHSEPSRWKPVSQFISPTPQRSAQRCLRYKTIVMRKNLFPMFLSSCIHPAVIHHAFQPTLLVLGFYILTAEVSLATSRVLSLCGWPCPVRCSRAMPSTLRLITIFGLRRFRVTAESAVCCLLRLKSC